MATLEDARRTARAQRPPDTSLLRVLTCGSVDDGKSTLLGRLLVDTDAVLEDQLTALDQESRRWGTQGAARDYALLLDGLSAEREQGITIDVAYRYFSTPRRSFIIADTPGHEQYTRNMATGASNADLAIILIDARKGVLPQTRRHAFIAATLGVRHAVLAINKMDLIEFSQERWEAIVDAFRGIAGPLGFRSIVPIPICAREGDNVAAGSARMAWYEGPNLLEHLETVVLEPEDEAGPFHMPVQLVLRPDAEFRGYAGTIASGTVRAGDPVHALPSMEAATIARIVTADGDRLAASAGEAVTLTLSAQIDVSRGDVLAAADGPVRPASRLRATLLWMAPESLMTGREYTLQLGPATANARVWQINHAVHIETYERRSATWLGLNEIGSVELVLDRELVATPYCRNRTLGALILVDRLSSQTVAMGVVEEEIAPTVAAGGRWRAALRSSRLTGTVLGGVAMAVLAAALSRDLALAAALGFANMLLRPVLDRMVRAPE